MPEEVPANPAQAGRLGRRAALLVHSDERALVTLDRKSAATDAGRGSAFRAINQTPTCAPNPIPL